MSEEKPLPCAFCGSEAKTVGAGFLLHACCPAQTCLFGKDGIHIGVWNILMAIIEEDMNKLAQLYRTHQINIIAEYSLIKKSVIFKHWVSDSYEVVSERAICDYVKKRHPRTGIKKQVDEIVRQSK